MREAFLAAWRSVRFSGRFGQQHFVPLSRLLFSSESLASRQRTLSVALEKSCDCFLVSTGMRSDEMLEGVVAIPLDMDEAMNVGYVVHRERKLSSRAQEYIAELNQLIMDCTDKNALVPSKEVARAVAGDTDGAADDTQDAPEDATPAEQHAVRRPRPSTPT